jgi:superfamily II DNA or RNA helicase
MNPPARAAQVALWEFEEFVHAEIDGYATDEQLAALEADPVTWHTVLKRLLEETEENLKRAKGIRGEERAQVVADLEDEHWRLRDAVERIIPDALPPEPEPEPEPAPKQKRERQPKAEEDIEPGPIQLQLSWEPGRVVAWAAGRRNDARTGKQVMKMLAAAGAPQTGWTDHQRVSLPRAMSADAFSIPVGDVLGWLVAAGANQIEGEISPGAEWLGRVAIWAVELTAQGAIVPQLRRRTRKGGSARESSGSYAVRWTPALVDPERVETMAAEMPGAVAAIDRKVDPRALIRSALTGMVDAICRNAARQLEVPAPPPRVRTPTDVSEAFLARLDGSAFDAPVSTGSEIATKIERWGRSVTGQYARVVVQMDSPDASGGWLVQVFAQSKRGQLTPIEQAIVMGGSERTHLEDEIVRLERMIPALARPGSHRRGQVIIAADEAWELMTELGPHLQAAGFDVRVPAMSRKRAKPQLRVFVETAQESAVGAQQLSNVQWSARFDDVELTAEDISRLAKEARPLIRSGDRWVAVDKADLKAAAEALAERADKTQMTGAEMLRLALGLERSPLSGGVSVEGGGWAADLLKAAARVATEPAKTPKGFVGTLRSYQAEALAWLGFLDDGGLGGCLALDMGLGKTPTLLAHLLANKSDGPALVIAPPAVVGNWLAESARFAPKLRVVVHHGANRARSKEIKAELKRADVVVTTYGTAVRDVDALAEVDWARVVLDEAQAIKNPANDTSQLLRKIPARMRVALTGTPIENGLGDLWAILDFTNPGLVGGRPQFIAALSNDDNAQRIEAEDAMRALNGILVFRRTKAEPEIAAELPDQIDELDHCAMTQEQIGLYQALLDTLVTQEDIEQGAEPRKGQILAAITALKQICNHPWNYINDDKPLEGRSGKLARLEEIVEAVFAAGEKVLVFTHFAEWGQKLAEYLTERTGTKVDCYHGGLTRVARDQIVADFESREGSAVLVLSLKAGGTGLNLTAASHVVLYDRWWNPAVEDQARDRAWRIGQTRTVICHRLICPGTVDERVEEVVAGKRRIADLVLPKSSSIADLSSDQLRAALGIRSDALLTEEELIATGGV